jgi:hypothetical protein
MVPGDRRQLNGESQRSAACLCFCGATIATVDEHIRSAHRGVGASMIPGNSSRTATTAARPLERVFKADQKDTHWGKRKLARDR